VTIRNYWARFASCLAESASQIQARHVNLLDE